ncbi:DUF6574 domain-containing protein [Pseudolactococcus reticulitermitis]|uniref:Uncharacterized protein n=1 Tax=Pseudolactococcus reticulitermitis TaxID=2025039 RepID=A0A224WZG9_9LACT|nr:DUF6574 domain-containing protein [Lactococcus reticulitermitis]GAX47459.1 hypothetical protein RsY01_1059 [Lactococcus reticulitermitis]
MNKADWIEYFEAVNSRTPSEEEIAQALAAGEFSETEGSEVVEDTAAAETVTPVETAAPIGADVTTGTPEETKTATFKAKEKEVIEKLKENQTIANTAQVASSYLTWLLETVKRPMTKASGFNSLYAYLTLAIIVIFSALSTTLNLHAFYEKSVISSTFSDFSSFVGISPANPIGFGTFVGLLFAVALFILTLVFSTWVGLKILKSPLTFSNVVDKYTSLFVPATFLIVLATLLSLIRLNMLSYIIFVLALSIVGMATYYIVLTAKNNLKLDDFYAKLLALFTSGVIMSVITFILTLIFITLIFKSAFTL